jgi:hypothetical protein
MGIYQVSMKSPLENNDSEYDTIDTSLIDQILLKKEFYQEIGDNNDHHISFVFRSETINGKEHIYIIGRDDIKEIKHEITNIQELIDDLASHFYENKLPDSSDLIKDIKKDIISKFTKQLLNEKDILCVNSNYDCFGYILSEDNKIGTFDNIFIEDIDKISFEDYQSIIDLNNGKELNAIFYIDKKKVYTFNIDSVNNNEVKISNFNKKENYEITEDILNLKSKSDFAQYDDYLQSRRQMVTIEQNKEIEIDLDIFDI